MIASGYENTFRIIGPLYMDSSGEVPSDDITYHNPKS